MFYNSHRKLRVWQEAMKLVSEVYKLMRESMADGRWPKYETYALCDQLRRAVVSIPTNIAEGNARQYDKEKRQFFYIALGSLAEVSTLLDVAENLSYFSRSAIESEANRPSLSDLCEAISRMLSGFVGDSSGSAIVSGASRPSKLKAVSNS